MLAKEKVKKQLKRQFKKPIPSTQYIAFQKEHRDYPSYHQLKGLYGSWDVLSWEVWGVGTKVRTWSSEEAIQEVLKVCPMPISSTAYQKERLKDQTFLPTYSVLKELFGSWSEISEAIWGVKRDSPTSWESLDEMKSLILSYFPTPVASSAYVKQRKLQQLPLPAIDVLYQRLGTWKEVQAWLWQSVPMEWTSDRVKERVLQVFPERVGRETYHQKKKEEASLPPLSVIHQYYGAWGTFANELWGIQKEPTKKEMILMIRSLFSSRPLQEAYEIERLDHPELWSVYQLEQRFGSWDATMQIAFGRESLQFTSKPQKNNRYTDEQLIQQVRDGFEERPSIREYQALSQKRRLLPGKNTLISRFGSWEEAMNRCFPSSQTLNERWSPEEIQAIVKKALMELGETMDVARYNEWRSRQPERVPTVGAIARHFGSFYELLSVLGVSQANEKRKTPRTTDSMEVSAWMELYFDQLTEKPTVKNYSAFAETEPEAPSVETLRRCYGPSWEKVIQTFAPQWETRSFLRYTDDDLKEALWTVYQAIGNPMTRVRYDEYRDHHQPTLPSSSRISSRFHSWKQALATLNIPSYHYTSSRRHLMIQSKTLQNEAGLKTLNDFLNWALED